MILYVNNENEIKDVNTTSDPSLIALEINDETNPFKGWSIAKICCYKVIVVNGEIVMLTPYVDSKLIEHIDQLGIEAQINATDAADLRAAVEELYEMLESEEQHG